MHKALCNLYLVGWLILTSCGGNYVKDATGTIRVLSADHDSNVIVTDSNNRTTYWPKNLPDGFKKDGLKVVFSGKVGKIPPNAESIGTPLELTKIEELK